LAPKVTMLLISLKNPVTLEPPGTTASSLQGKNWGDVQTERGMWVGTSGAKRDKRFKKVYSKKLAAEKENGRDVTNWERSFNLAENEQKRGLSAPWKIQNGFWLGMIPTLPALPVVAQEKR